jgi:carboxyl-terminal processing protease
MPRRNLYLVLAVTAVSVVCYQRSESAQRDRYGRMFSTFSDVLREIDQNYVEQVDERRLFEGALSGMVGQLDQYSAYIGPKAYQELQENLDQRFGGIGIQVSLEGDDRRLMVESPLFGTPAYKAGLQAGDLILRINDESTEGFTLQDAVDRLRGPPGTKVRMTIQHAGAAEPVDVELERAEIKVDTVLGDTHAADDTWDFRLQGEEGIGYIRITQFSEGTADELKLALERLRDQGMKGLILDLRNNPGGLLEGAVQVADLFIEDGVIVSTRGRDGVAREMFTAVPDGTFAGFPMVVLVNNFSASASEIVAAALEDHGRATIVGSRTWGKGSVQNVIPLEGGESALKLTMASYWRPSGRNIHRISTATEDDEWGVRPTRANDVPLEGEALTRMLQSRRQRDVIHPAGEAPAAGGSVERNDPQLQRAIDVLREALG